MVTVYSCRDTADKQTIFTEMNRETIKDVRCSLFEVCGTSANMKEDLPLSAVHDTDKFLGVSTVVIEQDSVDITSKKVIEDVLQTSVVICFDESSVSFNPETAELAYPTAAQTSLE